MKPYLQWMMIYVFLSLRLHSFGQIESYVYPISATNDSLKAALLYSVIPRNDSGKNIYLLSEIDHSFKSLDNWRTLLIEQLISRGKAEKIFYENTWEHDTLLQNYMAGVIRIEDYREQMQSKYLLPFKPASPDSTIFPYYTYVQQEYLNLENDNYLPFFKRAKKYQYHEKLEPIDIGTQTLYLGLYHMAKVTRALNKTGDPVINNFLDSIRMKCRAEYARMAITTDDETAFKKNEAAIFTFLKALKTSIGDSVLVNRWQSVFAVYFLANRFRELSVSVSLGGRVLTPKEYLRKQSFRDSVLYENFKFYLPPSWNNIVVSFSTAHLMDTRRHADFSDMYDPDAKTLGKYLHEDFAPHLRRIAFICYNRNEGKKGVYINKNEKKSLEFAIAQKFDLAFVDLKSYREKVKARKPFYMRPTFRTYRKLNWEDLFDGIVFVKHCNCQNP